MRGSRTSYFRKNKNYSINQPQPLTPLFRNHFPRRSQPWRDTVKKQLGAALLVVTLSCAVASADQITPYRNMGKHQVTFVEKIHQAWNHLFNWF
jgi:hypothetical protein